VNVAAVLVACAFALGVLYLLDRWWSTWQLTRERAFERSDEEAEAAPSSDEEAEGLLQRWLFLAGFRAPRGPHLFLACTVVLLGLGAAVVVAAQASGVTRQAARALAVVPGGVGDLFLPIIYLGPWFVLVLLTSLPCLVVRSARQKRVTQVEEDLPITLELLATLSESGLSFDAALQRILASQPAHRPLAQELRTFQLEVLAGRSRTQCLRRLGRRLDVASVTIVVSALAQADQVGAGVADVLRRQSEDQRGRRRDGALTLASGLPVKLLFPLVICFLPGILLSVLGPMFYHFVQMADNILKTRGLR
jgi:tight adherence protein C